MNKPRIIFFDIDGTLLSPDTHRIPDSAKQALADAKAQGVLLFIASGRHINFVKADPWLGSFAFDGYVTLNGGYCIVGDDQVIHHTPIERADMQAALDYIAANHATCVFCERDRLYIGPDMQRDHEGINSNGPTTEDLARVQHNDIYQLSFLGLHHREGMEAVMPSATTTSWAGDGFDVIAKATNKLAGVKQVVAHYGLSLTDAAAIGDGENDMEMLQGVGWGIAMGNASDEVKAVASYITDDIEADGLSKAMAYLLDRE